MMRDQKIYRAAYWLACYLVAAALLSGYQKLLYPADFALAVYRFHLLPDGLVNAASLYFPWLEVVCAACLLFVPKFREAALWISLALLLIFTVAIGINLYHGTAFGCGCFGSAADAQPMDGMSVVRNVLLMLLIGMALWVRKRGSV